jgi:hypothetical protein
VGDMNIEQTEAKLSIPAKAKSVLRSSDIYSEKGHRTPFLTALYYFILTAFIYILL